MEIPQWFVLTFAGVGLFLSLLIVLGIIYNGYMKRLERLGGAQSEILRILDNYEPEARAEMLQASLNEARKTVKEYETDNAAVLAKAYEDLQERHNEVSRKEATAKDEAEDKKKYGPKLMDDAE